MGAPGAAAFSGSWLSAHGGARGAQQLGTGVPEAVDYLGEHRLSIFLCQTVCQLFCLYLIVKTTYIVVAGGEEESLFSVGGRWQWCYWVVWLGGIYGSMVWGEFLKTRARAVGDVIDRDIVFSFCLVS